MDTVYPCGGAKIHSHNSAAESRAYSCFHVCMYITGSFRLGRLYARRSDGYIQRLVNKRFTLHDCNLILTSRFTIWVITSSSMSKITTSTPLSFLFDV
jgi:hypothetical protein